ncbi:unnamed protein product [Cuscuta epithymum]|uniref:Helitron helicase-like domain-containing protein n=1 Tax=Cuscuta epithymum TaxID=186058 RepID=A0AAV0ET65_9ASTE|nr:unnamed protein product [Cuscuta epithymum]
MNESSSTKANPKYSLCCSQGKVKLPVYKEPPLLLQRLIDGRDARNKHFIENIKSYNNMFAFTSMGGRIETSINKGKGPPIFKLHGQNYHLIGSLIPTVGSIPKFAQLYIYDTENELQNRIKSVRGDVNANQLHIEIVEDLRNMLNDHNVLVKSFRMAKETIHHGESVDMRLRLIGKRNSDARTYNLPTVSEVAALVVGDFDESMGERDILVETQSGKLQHINELNPAYFGLQYPLLFPFGEDGYREDIALSGSRVVPGSCRRNVSIRQFLAYLLQEREFKYSTILKAKRLF